MRRLKEKTAVVLAVASQAVSVTSAVPTGVTPGSGPVNIDRSEVNRALAKAIAYKQCGKDYEAEVWAVELIRLLDCADVLNERPDPFAQWKADLGKAIDQTIRELKRDGTVACGLAHLRMCVRPPAGGPTGTNAQWIYAQMFKEAVDASPSRRRFVQCG